MPFFERVYEAVRAIPRGRVATYGQVARLVGVPRGARAVGWALRALDPRRARAVPWHRVVGAGGRISPRAARDRCSSAAACSRKASASAPGAWTCAVTGLLS